MTLKDNGFDLTVSVSSLIGSEEAGLGLTAGTTIGGGYNNYSGVYLVTGSSVSLSIPILKKFGLGAGVSLGMINDTRADKAKYYFGAGPNLSFYGFKNRLVLNGGINFSYIQGDNKIRTSIGGGVGIYNNQVLGVYKELGKEEHSATEIVNKTFDVPNLMSVPTNSIFKGKQKNINVTVPIIPLNIWLSADVNLRTMTGVFGSGEYSKKLFGTYYLSNYDRTTDDHLPDFSIEGQYNVEPNESVPYMQKDAFFISAAGLSGNFELMHSDVGVFSRPESRSKEEFLERGGFLGINFTNRLNSKSTETKKWLHSGRISINKNTDVLSSLIKDKKNAVDLTNEGKDIEDVYFNHSSDVVFNNGFASTEDLYFKMRGEYSGQYSVNSKVSSSSNPLAIGFETLPTHQEKNKFYSAHSRVSYPIVANQRQINDFANKLKDGNNERSTNIKSFTVGDLMSEFYTSNGSLKPEYQKGIDHSIYSQYISLVDTKFSLSDAASFRKLNVLEHLRELLYNGQTQIPEDREYISDLIAGFEITSSNGVKYCFTTPVFTFDEHSYGLKGDGFIPPVLKSNSYSTNSDYTKGALHEHNNYYYAHSWLLTAIIQPDFIDYDEIPGPSDGDLGNWVRFNYIKSKDDYTWRTPMFGTNHQVGNIQDKEDDYYSLSFGNKEIYYLASVESREHESIYTYNERLDGYGAKARIANGNPDDNWNYLSKDRFELPVDQNYIEKSSKLYCVSDITLFQKNNLDFINRAVINREDRIPLNGTKFLYDYSTGIEVQSFVQPISFGEHILDYLIQPDQPDQIGNGHLTLKEVVPYTYHEGEKYFLPSTEFNYSDDNYTYDSDELKINSIKRDQWGNFNVYALKNGDISTGNYLHNNYEVLSKEKADRNANVFKLQSVKTPTGGELSFEYEARSYGKVQDKAPYVMRSIKVKSAEQGVVKLKVDISDIVDMYERIESSGKNPSDYGLTDSPSLENVFKLEKYNVGSRNPDELYGEIAFYRNVNEKTEVIQRIGKGLQKQSLGLALIGDTTIVIESYEEVDDENYETITIKSTEEKETPFVSNFRKYMLTESEEKQAIEHFSGTLDLNESPPEIDKDIWKALKKLVRNTLNTLPFYDNIEDKRLENKFGELSPSRLNDENIYNPLSFLRTPVLSEKYSGARVASIISKDNFKLGTNGSGENVQKVNYYYDQNGDGSGFCSGVALSELGFGPSRVMNVADIKGTGFLPSAGIIYEKVTKQIEVPKTSLGQKVIRPVGKVESTFITPSYNNGEYLFENNFTSHIVPDVPLFDKSELNYRKITGYKRIRKPFRFSIRGKKKKSAYWTRRVRRKVGIKYTNEKKTFVHVNRYIDVSDHYGKLIKQVHYDENGGIISQTSFKFKSPDSFVKIASNQSLLTGSAKNILPGVSEQIYGEMILKRDRENEIKRRKSKLKTTNNYSLVYTDYVYVPPVIESEESYIEGKKQIVDYELFDPYTLEPLLIKNYVAGQTYWIENRPAYWDNPFLGPHSKNPNYQNRMREMNQSVSYKHFRDDNHVLSASFVKYGLLDHQNANDFSVPETKIFYPEINAANNTRKVLQTVDYKHDALPKKINKALISNQNYLLKPVETYQLVSTLTNEGYIKDYGQKKIINNQVSGSDWKNVNTITSYHHDGQVLESKDLRGNYYSSRLVPGLALSNLSVSMAPYGLSYFTSADYKYEFDNHDNLISSPNLSVNETRIISEVCDNTDYSHYQALSREDYRFGSVYKAHILSVNYSDFNGKDIPICKIQTQRKSPANDNIEYPLLMLTPEGNVYGTLPSGHVFNTFLVRNINSNSLDIIFPPRYFQDIVVLDKNISPGVDVSDIRRNQVIPDDFDECFVDVKRTVMSNVKCVPDIHSGKSCFILDPGKNGLSFTFDYDAFNKLPIDHRELSVKLWVQRALSEYHELTPEISVIKLNDNTEVYRSEEKDSQYLSHAGNWSLLEFVVNLSIIPFQFRNQDYKYVLSLNNNSGSGEIIFDDVLIKPKVAESTALVYDFEKNRPVEVFSNSHLMQRTVYDEFYRPSIIFSEIEEFNESNNGIVPAVKNIYGFQKPYVK